MLTKNKKFLFVGIIIVICFVLAWAQDEEYKAMNPFTGNLDATRTDVSINGQWLRLDASNDPLSGDLSIGGNTLDDVEALQFDTGAVEPAYSEGIMYWNGGILQVDTDIDHLHYNPGVNLTTKVVNKTGSTILKGKIVYINGSQGGSATIALADNASEITSDDTLGFVQADVLDNGFTYIVTAGLLKKQDTSGFSAGDKLYLGTNGNAINTEPVSPAHLITLGHVKKVNVSTGEIDIRVNVGWELEEIHNVLITSIADKQTLYWDNANSLWKNSNTLLIDEGNGVIITNGSRLNFRDSAIGIYSQANTFLDLFADGAVRIGDSSAGAPTNYSQFSSDGTLTMTGTARVKKHLVLTVGSAIKGASAPTSAIIGNYAVLQFSNIITNNAYITFHTPDDWAVGTDIQIHVHWAPVNGNAGDVVWDIDYSAIASDNNELISGAGTNITVTDSTQSLQDELLQTSDMTIAGASIADFDAIGVCISRDTGDVADTYGSAASLIYLEINYTSNRLGLDL